MNLKELREELDSSFKTRKVALKWLFGEIEFSRDEFLGLFEVEDHIAEIVNKSFVERFVMHADLTKEDPDESIASLTSAGKFLDSKIEQLRGKLDKDARGLIRLIEQLRSDVVLHAKKLRQLKREIDRGNASEMESDYRLRVKDWLPEPLRQFRLAVYPVFRSMMDVLPKDHPATQRALDLWYAGRASLTEVEKDQSLPQWQKKSDS